jgi:hypothetical protein
MSAEEKAVAHCSLWPKVQPVRTSARSSVMPTPPVLQLSYPNANLGAQVVDICQDINSLQASIMQLISQSAVAVGAPLLQLAVLLPSEATNGVARVCCA